MSRLTPLEQDQEILWINAVFEMEEGYRKEHCSPLPKICLPLCSLTLGDVVGSLKDIIHDNFMAGVFTIGKCYLSMCFIVGLTASSMSCSLLLRVRGISFLHLEEVLK